LDHEPAGGDGVKAKDGIGEEVGEGGGHSRVVGA
jgi:hypothetical protein